MSDSVEGKREGFKEIMTWEDRTWTPDEMSQEI